MPQSPPLTKFALVRRANLIEADGAVVPSHLTESVQVRTILTVEPNHSSGGKQAFAEFRLDPQKLLLIQGSLTPLGADELAFSMVFRDHDTLESPLSANVVAARSHVGPAGQVPVMQSCFACHSRPGIFSMNAYIQFFQPHATLRPPDLHEGDDAPWYTAQWKEQQYNWGLLQAYWGLSQP